MFLVENGPDLDRHMPGSAQLEVELVARGGEWMGKVFRAYGIVD